MSSPYRKPLPGTDLDYFDARAAVDAIQPGAWDRLPYTSRVHAENLVRRCDPAILRECLEQLVYRRRERDFPWFPARVVCHDILGQTALVDLAGLRDAIADQGGDPAQVNPVVPVQLIVDHSLAVECGGYDPDAFAKNRAIEDRRNEDRFHFIEWTKKAFRNVDVIPPGNGIMHQINLEKMSPVIQVQDGVAFPDTCVGTDSHTPHVDALGVIAVGVGGLEAENVMLGRASWMRLPEIVGVELTGRPQPGITATDVVLSLTEFLRKQKVVGSYLEFRGEGAAALTLGDRATISNMAPEYGATAAMFFIDGQTLDYLRLTGRDEGQVKLVETYAKTAGLWADALATAEYERTLTFDLSGVVRTMAGPSNPHARVSTTDLAAKGIAGGLPLAAVTGRAEIMDASHAGGLGGTYGGNPIACAAALAAIDVFENDGVIERAREIGEILTTRLTAMQKQDARIGDIRGHGAMIAAEFVDPETQAPDAALTAAVAKAAIAQGVIVLTCGTYGNVIRFLPPLAIGDELLNEGLDVVAAALAAA